MAGVCPRRNAPRTSQSIAQLWTHQGTPIPRYQRHNYMNSMRGATTDSGPRDYGEWSISWSQRHNSMNFMEMVDPPGLEPGDVL